MDITASYAEMVESGWIIFLLAGMGYFPKSVMLVIKYILSPS